VFDPISNYEVEHSEQGCRHFWAVVQVEFAGVYCFISHDPANVKRLLNHHRQSLPYQFFYVGINILAWHP